MTDAVCEIIEKGETCDDFGILDDDNDDKLVVGSETECEILEKGETFDDCWIREDDIDDDEKYEIT